MQPSSTGASDAIRQRFQDDHRRLEALLARLLAAFEANDREDMEKLWSEFADGLLAHLDAEETYLFPNLERVSKEETANLLADHNRFRERLTELGVVLDLHIARLDTVRAFIDELRGHAKKEDHTLYQLNDDLFDRPKRSSVLEALAALVRGRGRPVTESAPFPPR